MISLSKQNFSLLLRSPTFLKVAATIILAITVSTLFENTDKGKRWKAWLNHLHGNPSKLDQMNDSHIMKLLLDHHCIRYGLDFLVDSDSDQDPKQNVTSPNSKQKMTANCGKFKLSMHRSMESLPNLSHSSKDRVRNFKKEEEEKDPIHRGANFQILPFVLSNISPQEPLPSAIYEEARHESSIDRSNSEISMFQLSLLEQQNPWTIVERGYLK